MGNVVSYLYYTEVTVEEAGADVEGCNLQDPLSMATFRLGFTPTGNLIPHCDLVNSL